MSSVIDASNAVRSLPIEAGLSSSIGASDSWVLPAKRLPTPQFRPAVWPRNLGGFVGASLLLHVAALAAVLHPWPSGNWQLRLPKGHNQVALAASVSSPRAEAEAKVRIELPPADATDEPLSKQEAELPVEALAQFASAQVDARVPPPADAARRDSQATPTPPDRPVSKPPKRTSDARVPPRETAMRVESVASAPSLQSSGVKDSAPPSIVVSVKPVYPPVALAGGMQGVVRLRVRVNAKGEVVAASLHQTSGHELLDQAALEVIFRWRYSPPDGEAGVAAEFIDKITFEINR